MTEIKSTKNFSQQKVFPKNIFENRNVDWKKLKQKGIEIVVIFGIYFLIKLF